MRLKEPLQGIKISQGHIIIHLAFFLIIQFFTDTSLTEELAEKTIMVNKKLIHPHEWQQNAIIYLKWSHLLLFVIQGTVLVIKRMGYWQLGQILLWLAFFCVYLLAVIYNFFVLKVTSRTYYCDGHQVFGPMIQTQVW